MSEGFVDKAGDAAAIMAEQLDEKLIAEMAGASWSHDLSFYAADGKIYLSYEESEEGQIFNSEYGSESKPHNSVLRPLLREAEKGVYNMTALAAVEYLFSEGLV